MHTEAIRALSHTNEPWQEELTQLNPLGRLLWLEVVWECA